MKPTTLTKSECVRRARNLNQQALAWAESGKRQWAKDARLKRDQYMQAARLFATPQAAGDAWDDPQSGAYDPREGGEPVDVMPHYGYAGEGNQSVFFRSRANRAQMLLIGPLGLDTACDEERGHIVGLPEVVNDPSTTN